MIDLYDHQIDMVHRTREALARHHAVILRAPTGCGKTLCAAHIVKAAIAKGSRVIFTVHRRELIRQTRDAFDLCEIPYGVICAGMRPDPVAQVQIASIDTLKRRMDRVHPADLLIVDECHHANSTGWSTVIKGLDCHVVGLTATPWRLDGRGLGDLFGEIVHGPEMKWLIDNKFLSPFRAFAPSSPDMSGVSTRMGDYAADEAEQKMDKPTITGDAVDHYRRIANGKRAIAFAVTVEHSKHIAECFNANGIAARHIDGNTSSAERDQAIAAFKNNEIKVLTNCNIISEGFDVPAMDVAILLRPTKSLSLYLQQIGRAMRYIDGKTAIILDHANNIKTHGLPTDTFNWSLSTKKKRKREISEVLGKICPACFCFHESVLRTCPNCGHFYEVKGREIEEVDGHLAEINLETWIKTAPYKRLVDSAATLEDLEKIRKIKKYKYGWSQHILRERAS